MRAIKVSPRLAIDNRASKSHSVLEVSARDRLDLLYEVTAVISEHGLQTASLHAITYGVRRVCVFYVRDVFGLKIEDAGRLEKLRQTLFAVMTSRDDGHSPLPTA